MAERESAATAGRKRVLIVNTGGTMGMKPTPEGLAPAAGYLQERICVMEEFGLADMPVCDVLDFDPLLDSADFSPAEWVAIAEVIEREVHSAYDGFVVVMGTDTLAYCASALSFMLENLPKPVVVTGSQIPLAEAFSDARRNLVVATQFAACLGAGPFHNEVLVFFGETLLRGCRATKQSALDLRAFASPNYPPLATLGVTIALRLDLARPPALGRMRVHKRMDTRVLVVRLVPGFDDGALERLVKDGDAGLRALVLEFYGVGSAPTRRAGLVRCLRLCQQARILVVATTQCAKGAVVLGQYAVGAELVRAGALSAGDMTTEAVATKLAYLFGRTDDPVRVAELLTINLRGELTEVPARGAHAAMAGDPFGASRSHVGSFDARMLPVSHAAAAASAPRSRL